MSDYGCSMDYGSYNSSTDYGSSSMDFSSNDYCTDYGSSSMDFSSNDYCTDYGSSSMDFSSNDYCTDYGSSSMDFSSNDYCNDYGSSSMDYSSYDYSGDYGSSSSYSDSLSFLYEVETDEPYRDEWTVPSLTDRINSDSNTYNSLHNNNADSLWSDETDSNPASSDNDWGTMVNAYLASGLPGSDWYDNVIDHTREWIEEDISYNLVNDPLQWAQDHPFAAAGIGATAIGGAVAYYNNSGNLSGGFGFNVGDWQFDFDLGLHQNELDGSDDFHFQFDVTYPF